MASLALIDPSGRMAATVQAVLGREHTVTVRNRMHAPAEADLVILDVPRHAPLDQAGLRSLRSFGPILVLLDRNVPVPSFLAEGHGLRVLRKPFESFELRLTVRRLLSGGASQGTPVERPVTDEEDRAWLEFPFVPAPASAILSRAVRLAAPLWIFGEPGCGRRRVARAVCRLVRPPRRLVTLLPSDDLDSVIGRAAAGEPAAILVHEIERRPVADQERLATMLETSAVPARLIAISRDDPAEKVLDGCFSADLYRRLIGLAVQLSPLRERPLAIPPLAQMIARRIMRQLGSSIDVSFAPDAIACLQTYQWPGNVVELEGVLVRTLVTLGEETLAKRPVGAEDILFLPDERTTAPGAGGDDEPVAVRPIAAEPEDVGEESRSGGGTEPVEGVVAELAHELRNPMSVIRSFASQAARRQPSPEDAQRLAGLADEACERIEGYLEEMEAFGRFGAPRSERISLPAVVGEVVAQTDGLTSDRVRIEGLAGVRVLADPDQARFVLRNVMATAAGEAGSSGSLHVALENGCELVVSVQGAGGPITKLHRLGEGGGSAPSWRLLLARSIAARNGWSLHVEVGENAIEIRCLLVVEEEGRGGQKSNSSDR